MEFGNSADIQYRSLREKIAAEKQMRADRNVGFATVWSNACAQGRLAGEACIPRPMIVSGYENAPILDGVCGFAYITIRPATSAFARWLKSKGIGHRAYYGGWEISVSDYGQSMNRKEAHAAAVADYLKASGIPADYYYRMD